MHGNETCFGCAIVGQVACCNLAEYGCHRNDCAACLGLEHSWKEGANCVEMGDEVYVEVSLHFLCCQFEEWFAVDYAGVVDQNGRDSKLKEVISCTVRLICLQYLPTSFSICSFTFSTAV